MTKYFIAFAMLLAVGAGCTFDVNPNNNGETGNGNGNNTDTGSICEDTCGNGTCEEITCQGEGCPCAETPDSCPQDCSADNNNGDDEEVGDLIHVNTPADDQKIGRPVTVTGEARGQWYFEATFPVKVYDANNNLLGEGYATAQGDWMTEDFVPFTATVTYTASTTATGKIVFEKSNASGLPEHDASLTVPVTF